MDRQELVSLLKTYDFIINSISSFSLKYGPTPKTIKKWLIAYDIPFKRKRSNLKIERDRDGKFVSNFKELLENDKHTIVKLQTIKNNKNTNKKSFLEIGEMINDGLK